MRLSEARREYYRRLARKKGFLSRAAFKLIQIDNKYRILRKGYKVLDIGCSPGGWSQVASRRVGDSGIVVGIDLSKASFQAKNFIFIKCDVTSYQEVQCNLSPICRSFDCILSDLSPKLIGIWDADSSRQLLLTKDAIYLLNSFLREGGNAVFKLFQGELTDEVLNTLRGIFSKVVISKPPASRKEASEVYAVCLAFKGARIEESPSKPQTEHLS